MTVAVCICGWEYCLWQLSQDGRWKPIPLSG